MPPDAAPETPTDITGLSIPDEAHSLCGSAASSRARDAAHGPSLEEIRRFVAELGALLAEDDILCVRRWRSEGALLEALQAVEARQIGEAIDNFEFELAHQYLNAFIAHHLEGPAG